MDDRRIAMLVLAGLAAGVVAAAVAIRAIDPDTEPDTAAVFGFLTLAATLIAALAGTDHD